MNCMMMHNSFQVLFSQFHEPLPQIWERSEEGFRGFRGCGSVWMPMAPGEHDVDLQLWKPVSNGLEGLSGKTYFPAVANESVQFSTFPRFHATDSLIPGIPDLTGLRELSISPFLRSQVQVVP